MINIFVITVTGVDRIQEKTAKFLNQVEPFSSLVYTGVDFRNKSYDAIESELNLDFAEYIVGGKLSPGEVGCLLSHQQVYETIVDKKIAWALVIEDDAELVLHADEIVSYMQEWHRKAYEIVHLSPTLGGVVVGEKPDKTGRALVFPLLTNAYWISLQGAYKLRSRNSMIGGVADWPVQVSRLKTRAVYQNFFANEGLNSSVIAITQNKMAHARINLSYRRFSSIFFSKNAFKLFQGIKVYGYFTIFRYVFLNRLYKRLFRITLRQKKGDNKTIFLKKLTEKIS